MRLVGALPFIGPVLLELGLAVGGHVSAVAGLALPQEAVGRLRVGVELGRRLGAAAAGAGLHGHQNGISESSKSSSGGRCGAGRAPPRLGLSPFGWYVFTAAYHLPLRLSLTSMLTQSPDRLDSQSISSSRLIEMDAFTKSGALGFGALTISPSTNSVSPAMLSP